MNDLSRRDIKAAEARHDTFDTETYRAIDRMREALKKADFKLYCSVSARAWQRPWNVDARPVGSGDTAALPLLQAMIDGDVQTVGEDRVLIVKDG